MRSSESMPLISFRENIAAARKPSQNERETNAAQKEFVVSGSIHLFRDSDKFLLFKDRTKQGERKRIDRSQT